jgi:hypothetical protein
VDTTMTPLDDDTSPLTRKVIHVAKETEHSTL